MRVSLCYELISSAERNKRGRGGGREKQANGTWEKHTVSTSNSDPITATSSVVIEAK
jgi:hypothetical protein